jgi:hypothetical protein
VIASAHLIPEFLLRVADQIDFSAKPPFDPAQSREQVWSGGIADQQEIDVALRAP